MRVHDRLDVLVGTGSLVNHARVLPALNALCRLGVVFQGEGFFGSTTGHGPPGAVAKAHLNWLASQKLDARVLGANHSATMALAKAAITMDKADLWQARLAVKTLRWDQREAIAEAAED